MRALGWILLPIGVVCTAIIVLRGLGAIAAIAYGFYNAPFPWWVTIPAALFVIISALYLWDVADRRSKISSANRR